MNTAYKYLFSIAIVCYLQNTNADTIISNHKNACWDSNVEIAGVVEMTQSCKASGGVKILTSNTSLDCHGATIDLGYKEFTGIEINSQGKELSNIKIKNCNITHSKFQGIYIGWKESDGKKANQNTIPQLYQKTPHNILIENTNIIEPGSSGIYIDDYTRQVILNNISIVKAPAMAIYFEFSSRDNKLINSKIIGNGLGHKREAISIDSSQNNLISNNLFENNAYGGVFVYKNCSEHLNEDQNQTIRWLPSNYNKITHNTFKNNNIAIWLASRQSMNLINAKCGNGYYAENKYTLDEAQYNYVSDNTIENSNLGVIVEDNNNIVEYNNFKKIKQVAIRVGTPIRNKYLGLPVMNTYVGHNFIITPQPLIEYKWGSKP